MNSNKVNKEIKILFFAVRSHHYSYFCKLAGAMYSSIVVSRKQLWLPLFRQVNKDMLKQAVACLVMEYKNKLPFISIVLPLLAGFLYVRARILCACYCRAILKNNITAVAVWNGQRYRQMIMLTAAASFDLTCLYFENGLLPNHTTIDNKGVNYLNSMPREAAQYLGVGDLLNKKNAAKNAEEKYIFVPFQVETDSQILQFSPWIYSMRHLIAILTEVSWALPRGWCFICKPHPYESKKHKWLLSKLKKNSKLKLADKDADTHNLINHAKGVITINSTVGIESILASKKVIVVGQAFYAISGLTLKANNQKELGEAIGQLDGWEINQKLRKGFIAKLKTYQVEGSWQQASTSHIELMSNRILELI